MEPQGCSKAIFEAHDSRLEPSSLRKLLAPLLPAILAEVRICIHRLPASGTCSLLESRGRADCCQTNIYSVTRRLSPSMLLVCNEVALAHSKDRDKQPRQPYMERCMERCTWCMDAVYEHMSAFRQTLLRRMWFPSLPNVVHPTTRHKNCPFKEKFCHRWPKDMLMCRMFPSQGSSTLSHINSILLYAFSLLVQPVLGLGRAVASYVLSQPRSWQGFPTLE